ncbi:hypothetical protein ZIOFF_024450 [Zingiber officinale]|uniref:Protein kinase domain-containing protein n=1 Tax=Zingiber officinale TaxID=94328 RepID=A0A8J5L686_ZINOF|nr:hypothetical protein ZIOFF_024450 [Zingiber officinale]
MPTILFGPNRLLSFFYSGLLSTHSSSPIPSTLLGIHMPEKLWPIKFTRTHQLQHEVTIELAVLLSNEITIIKLGYAILRRIPKKLRLFSREDDLPPPQPFQELSASFGGFGIETTHRYWLSEINDATENFAKKVGSGGYGTVYYGKLKNGKEIAVKVQTNDSCQGNRQFSSEVSLLSRIHHRNLVEFLGYCQQEGKSILVYEFMHNGALKEHLHGKHHFVMFHIYLS